MGKHTKLELTWIGKNNRPKLEPRILIEDPERSYHAPHRVRRNDIFDNILIHNPAFNTAMLAEALCKLEGFTYAPSEEVFWMHGHSTEQDFIYVTTRFMSGDVDAD